jgi:hypothetical protein
MVTNMNDEYLEKHLDKQIVLEGFALNAKAGAIVMIDQTVVYVKDLKEWPEDFVEDRVAVKGILHRGQVYKDVEFTNGAVSQGISGQQWYIDMEGYRRANSV